LTDVVSRRLKKTGIGFGADPAAATTLPAELLRLAGTQDFVDYGLEPEFIGRLPVRVVCESLAEGDLFEILKQSEGSLIRQYERAFAAYGIEAVFSDEALRHIASLAVRENTGARGLMTTSEGLLREFKYRLPGSPVRTLEVTPAVLENPDAAIERFLQTGAEDARQAQSLVIAQFAERFGEQHGYRFRFSPEALEAILAKSVEKNISARDLCEGLFKDYQFGLGLIHRNSGQTDFEIPAEAVESPDRVLSQWVVASHRTQDEHDENS
jgi:ATP-dependent protease Clp ATPase subunit